VVRVTVSRTTEATDGRGRQLDEYAIERLRSTVDGSFKNDGNKYSNLLASDGYTF
jgi:hypothetical protein